jgi:hypothetical protein
MFYVSPSGRPPLYPWLKILTKVKGLIVTFFRCMTCSSSNRSHGAGFQFYLKAFEGAGCPPDFLLAIAVKCIVRSLSGGPLRQRLEARKPM